MPRCHLSWGKGVWWQLSNFLVVAGQQYWFWTNLDYMLAWRRAYFIGLSKIKTVNLISTTKKSLNGHQILFLVRGGVWARDYLPHWYGVVPACINTSTFLFQICDLGSARSLEHTTRQSTAVGTYAWMAPEVGGCKHCYKSIHSEWLFVLMRTVHVFRRCFSFFLDGARGESLKILRCLLIRSITIWDSNTTTTVPWCECLLGPCYDCRRQGEQFRKCHSLYRLPFYHSGVHTNTRFCLCDHINFSEYKSMPFYYVRIQIAIFTLLV